VQPKLRWISPTHRTTNSFVVNMRLYLIRHGETVDNVAGLYAGMKDSPLTNHGVEQIKRLGSYVKPMGARILRDSIEHCGAL